LHLNFGSSSLELGISGVGRLLVASKSINDEFLWVAGSSIDGW